MNDEWGDRVVGGWTGERFELGEGSPEVHHEHLHRYAVASRCVAGLKVLDLGCGSGEGSAALAATADSVVAIDIDEETIGSAQARHESAIRFACGSAYAIPLEDASVDAVVCFEVIEHVDDPERVMTEISRVLTSTGFLIMSTPMKSEYNRGLIKPNPYHLHEMEHEEFIELVARHLPLLTVIKQRSMVVSAMWQDEGAGAAVPEMIHSASLTSLAPVYEIVVATSRGELPAVQETVYLDVTAQGNGEPEAVLQLRNARIQLAEWQDQVEKIAVALRNADARVEELEAKLAELQ